MEAGPHQRIVIVGAGGIGGGLGGLLAHAGFHVELVARGAHGREIRANGLRVVRPEGELVLRLPCHARVADVPWGPGDVAFVATKLGDAEAAYDEVLAAAGPDVPVVVGQNGVVADTWARARFRTVVDTVVWVPAQFLEPGRVELYGVPVPGAVALEPTGAWLAAALADAGFRTAVHTDLGPWKRAKWITNLCGHAIAKGRADLAPGLMEEGHVVLAAAGLEVASEALEAWVGDLRLATLDGRERLAGGSSAQSLVRGRPSEVQWLNGPLVDLAREVGVAVPLNEAVLTGRV
ncbi:MAG: 2-dehydropantoate 2-reductase N-terminal domain-containing protein [Myxococcota bacterium]